MTDKSPDHYTAYAIHRSGQTRRWVQVGAAVGNEDGFSIYLDRLPIGGFSGHILVTRSGQVPRMQGPTDDLSISEITEPEERDRTRTQKPEP